MAHRVSQSGLTVLVALVALSAVACPGAPPAVTPARKSAPVAAPPEKVVWQKSKSGLGFRLSNAEPDKPERPKTPPATPLDAASHKRVVARLPALPPAETKTYAARAKSIPAPRPGETIKTEFPPPPSAATAPGPSSTKLTVLRHAPDGAISVAPSLAITFSEPMVAITSHDDLAKEAAPFRIDPMPPGKTRWIGTQTVLFEPTGERFPMATEYTVEVPAGTRSALGHALERPERWAFETPRLRAEQIHPSPYGLPVDLQAIVFASFNQRIDRKALAGHLALTTPQGSHPFRLATDDEIEKDDDVRRLVQQAQPDRWIAIKPTEPLPKGATVTFAVARGAPSAEGPLATQEGQTSPFHVRGLLRLGHVRCGWYGGCPPLAPWTAELSNELDPSTFDVKDVRVEPALPGMKVDVVGNSITIRGRSTGRTKYTLTFSNRITDVFGQTLEQPATATVEVGEAEPFLFREQDDMVVLDPAFEPKLSVYSVNQSSLAVKLYGVTPGDWDRYVHFRQDYDWEGRVTAPPGKLLVSRTVRPQGERDALVETAIDLAPLLKEGAGQVLAVVEPPNQPKPRNRWEYRERQWVRVWVQVTKLGLTAMRDSGDVHAWITDLATGAPVADANVALWPAGGAAKTGADGLARLSLGARGDQLFAQRGADLVFLPGTKDSGTFVAHPRSDALRWFVFDDRKLYKPGERVHAKGWVRVADTGKGGDLGRLAGGNHEVRFRVLDPRGAELAKGASPVDDSDGFHLAFDLPNNANLGGARLELELDGGGWDKRYTHSFRVEEFRRPEFEVTAQASEGPHFVGKHALATVGATYFAGGGLPDAETQWTVKAEDAYFAPPNRDGFHFGKPRRFFWWGGDDDKEERRASETWKAKTDGEGKHRLRIDFDALDPAYPRHLGLEANVTDVNRQSWSARTSFVVHPASVTVGLREESQLLKAGSNVQLDVVVTDLEGASVPGHKVAIKSVRLEQTWRGRKLVTTERDPQTCTVTSAAEPVRCTMPTQAGGQHRVTAVVTDVHGRASQTQIDLWVLGQDPPENPMVQSERVGLVADRKEYKGGDTAQLLVSAPFAPAEGLLSLRRDGVVQLRRFRLERKSDTLAVKIEPSWLPDVVAHVDLVGARVREAENGDPDPSLPRRPGYAAGEVVLSIPPVERSLDIAIAPEPKALAPRGTTRIAVDVKGPDGKPVAGAALALVVVDESVLALAGYDLPDPLAVLYPQRAAGVTGFETRLRVALARPDTARAQLRSRNKDGAGSGAGRAKMNMDGLEMGMVGGIADGAMKKPSPMRELAKEDKSMPSAPPPPPPAATATGAPHKPGAGDAPPEPQPEMTVRTNFDPLAAFVPRLTTDAKGRAVATVTLPDNLTRYRVTAVATSGAASFGKAESDVTARLPLMVRPSAPRFLNYGDRFQLPVVLQNQTAQALIADVVVRASNAKLSGPEGLRVEVPANDRVEVRFAAAAAEPGTARFQVGAASRAGSDASQVDLPVWTPATSEAFATYGVIDQGAAMQPVRMPSNVYTEVGQLEVTTSSTGLQGLTDAVLYLVRYPFDCNEQVSSRMLAIAALRDVLGAFQADGLPPKEKLVATVTADIAQLARRQHPSGGWDYWRRDREPEPYVSVHVTNALVRAKDKGFTVPKPMLDRALYFLRDIKSHFPWWYTEYSRRTVRAYALSVRARAGLAVVPDARALVQELGGRFEGISMDGLGWLLSVLTKAPEASADVEAIRRYVDNKITETAGKAHFVTGVSDAAHVTLESSRRTDGILLEAYIEDRPSHDAIPKLAQGLLAHRKRGAWLNTQENVFVLLALDKYFQTYEKATPDFVARAWLGSELVSEQTFKGRSIDRKQAELPLSMLAQQPQPSGVTVSKDGTGRLYYRIGMQYVPKDLRPPPSEHGFSVTRRYEGADSPGDVKRDADGTWRVKLGSRVRVRLAMVAPARRYHVALVDPIPAGFEAQNSALAMTPSVPRDPKGEEPRTPWWWSRAWYEHQNLRDERVEAFASLLYGGTYDYTYVARATTPGDFVVPPPKAEEMYDPETFGRGAGDRVVVE